MRAIPAGWVFVTLPGLLTAAAPADEPRKESEFVAPKAFKLWDPATGKPASD